MINKEPDKKQDSALHVMGGIESSHDGIRKKQRRKFVKKTKVVDIERLFSKITAGSVKDLAKGITLIESIKNSDQKYAQQLLHKALPKTGNCIRIGISGVPGAGKSTFIETFGLMLCEQGLKVAVLAIDPSSNVTGGSVLGDKTRMEKLAGHPHAFIRPSPSAGTLGGVHKKTRESMLLCEAAGYDVILVETVGVGQSEVTVRNMVDFFILLSLTGAGDELQGMKKGIMEITDLFIIHKADGDNLRLAKRTVREYKQIVHFLQAATPGWETMVVPVSSLIGTGHAEVWELVLKFKEKMQATNYWDRRREQQATSWFHDMIRDRLIEDFFNEAGKKATVKDLEEHIIAGELTVATAVEKLFEK